jgi:hypothetical protein
MTKDKATALSSLFRYNTTIDYYLRSKYQDMRTSRLVTLDDLTWPRPLASVRSGHLEYQVSRSSYPGIDSLGSNQLYNIIVRLPVCVFNYFGFEPNCWRLFQKRVVCTKFDMYVFIPTACYYLFSILFIIYQMKTDSGK